MGGKALKHAVTRRFMRDEFIAVTNEIVKMLNAKPDPLAASLVRHYASKESFGDADFLIPTHHTSKELADLIRRKFSPTELVVTNASVLSFDYKELQVDLILSPASEYLFATNYYAFNDLGNFIGRTANRLGFKFGHNGLWYRFYDPGNSALMFRELLVTDHFTSALRFLGYDSNAYHLSKDYFQTPEDIYKYAATSEHFDPASYLLENRACEGRRRDKTRPMYNGMLGWLHKTYPELAANPTPKRADREFHLQRALQAFPEFKQAYRDAEIDLAEQKAWKRVFCGENYTAAVGVTGPELGKLMARHRVYFETHGLTRWASTLTIDTFTTLIKALEENNDTV
jgi:hypothetical protein